jgi:septal ring factor EnvC (AmiA/AmiB activator)
MKKIIVTLLTLVVIAWGYYIYRHKNRYIYKYGNTEVTDYSERIKAEKELETLKVKFRIMREAKDSLAALNQNSESPDETDGLNLEIAQLRSENEELKRKLDSREPTTNETSSTINSKKKNEKTLPIARNTRAIELQRYLTELYGDR